MGRRSDKIATRKTKSDGLKAKMYGLIGKRIVQYVKVGGTDPAMNHKLAEVLKQAKEYGVPKEIVERNMKKATDKSQADYQEVTYEAYGPGGTGFIIECLTDNPNRAASFVKPAISKAGGKVAESGSVSFNFTRCGSILVKDTTEDALFEAAMDSGAEDIVNVADEEGQASTSYTVYSAVENFGNTYQSLTAAGFAVDMERSGIVFRANAPVEVDDEAFAKCEKMLEMLLEIDDVDAVYSNCDGLEL